jgi:hypothetical protein
LQSLESGQYTSLVTFGVNDAQARRRYFFIAFDALGVGDWSSDA